MGAEALPASAGAKFTQAEFEALLSRAGESGARSALAAVRAETAEAEAEAAKAKVTDNTSEGDEESPASAMEQAGALGGVVGTLDNVGGLGIPFGSVLVGAIPGVIVGELIDGFLPPHKNQWLNVGAKVGAGYLGVQYGRRLLGNNGAMFFAGALTLQAVSQLLPIDQWVQKIVGTVRHTSVMAQAEAVVRQAQMGQAQMGAGTGYYEGSV